MRYRELTERAERVEVLGKSLTVHINPTAQQVARLFKQSRGKLKGIVIGKDMYWWDAYYAHHDHILELFHPDYPLTPYEAYDINGANPRMSMDSDWDCGDDHRPVISFSGRSDGLLSHPRLQNMLASNLFLLIDPSVGCVTYDRYINS